jgi:hypothetical protein
MRIAIWQTGDALAALADAVPVAARRGAPVDHLPGGWPGRSMRFAQLISRSTSSTLAMSGELLELG